jgi:hypothetical protein
MLVRHHVLQLLMQQLNLPLHQIEAFLLPEYTMIQCIDQVFRETEFGFEFVNTGFMVR